MTPGNPRRAGQIQRTGFSSFCFLIMETAEVMNMFNVHLNKTQADRNAFINNNYLLQRHDSSQVCEHEGET